MDQDIPKESDTTQHARFSRRKILTVGLGAAAGIVIAGAAGLELVSHGVLPGQQALNQLEGAARSPVPNSGSRNWDIRSRAPSTPGPAVVP